MAQVRPRSQSAAEPVLVAVAAVACRVPARLAASVDPAIALSVE
jgi:hypothetical protein